MNDNPTPNWQAIDEAIQAMREELTNAEGLELEDFIVNHCSNESFVDDDGNYPNLFRIFVTGTRVDA